MKIWRRYLILFAAVLIFGALRMPFEAGVAAELRAAGLSPPPIKIGTRDKIGQTSSAVALGGLRTLVATFLNLRAFTYFEEQRWDDVASTFDTMVDLAPKSRYYWETGSWHSSYNAASYYLYDSKMPALRRKQAWRAAVIRGRTFLERGIQNNPDDWSQWANLGFLLSDSNKIPAFRDPNKTFAASAEAYRRAAATGKAPPYVKRSHFYSFARVQGNEVEALAMARSLYATQENRTSTLLTLLLVLEAHEDSTLDVGKRAVELFGTSQIAYTTLTRQWVRSNERFPIYGMAQALEYLERSLSISPEKSIFNQQLKVVDDPTDTFTK